MQTALFVCLFGVAVAQVSSSSSAYAPTLATVTTATNTLSVASITTETNTLGVATITTETNTLGVVTGMPTLVTPSSGLLNATVIVPTSINNSTETAGVNATGVTSDVSQPTTTDSTGVADSVKPMVGLGFGIAGAAFVLLF